MNYVIDRIEGNTAVLYDESKQSIDVQLNELYPNPKEGDWLLYEAGEYTFDHELTEKMRKRNSDLLKKLINKG